jgi:hypothetical protein
MSIGPLFAEHRETSGLYGGEERGREPFIACATGFTPVRRRLSFARISPV